MDICSNGFPNTIVTMFTFGASMRFFLAIFLCEFLFSACNNKPSPSTEENFRPPQGSQALKNYISSPTIDPEVEKLANLGFKRYENNFDNIKTDRDNARALNVKNQSGGGRKDTWIKDIFDAEEISLIDKLKNTTAPQTFTISEIDKVYEDLIAKYPRDSNIKKAKIVFVTGVNVSYLHEAPLAKGAFLQLASQFNYLESPGPYKTTVKSYLHDKTQGPMGSIEAAAAALQRTATEDQGILQNALIKVLPKEHSKYYNNGYLELFKLSKNEKAALLNYIENNIKNLAILPQWVQNEASGVKLFQVFSAGPSFQGQPEPSANSDEGKLTIMLVAAQYEALAKLLVIRSLLIDEPVVGHITRVGGGVFNNPPETMNASIERVARAIVGFPNVHLYMHGFSNSDTTASIKATNQNLVDISKMDSKAFYNTQFPTKI